MVRSIDYGYTYRSEWIERWFTKIGTDTCASAECKARDIKSTVDIKNLTSMYDKLALAIRHAPNFCERVNANPIKSKAYDPDDHDSDCDDAGLCSKSDEIENALDEFLAFLLKPFGVEIVSANRYKDPHAETCEGMPMVCADWTYTIDVRTANTRYFGLIHLKCDGKQSESCKLTTFFEDYVKSSDFWPNEKDGEHGGEKCNLLDVFYVTPEHISLEAICDLLGLGAMYTNGDYNV